MSVVTSQTDANIYGANRSGEPIELPNDMSEFPRFLCRDETERTANMPPNLPRVAWYVRVQWMMRRTAPRRMAALSAAFVVVVPAAAALVLDKSPALVSPQPAVPLQLNVIQVKSIDQVPAQVSDAPLTSADLETRLGYGTNIATANSETQLANSTSDQHAEAILTPAESNDTPGSPALLILRNLPENVTFTNGERSGKGEWVMAAGDPNQLEMTLGEGFDQPVAADVELVSHAGLTLGNLHLELRRNIAAVAEAQAAPEPQEAVSLTEATEAQNAEPQEEVKQEANKAESKPRKRAHRAISHSKQKFARADGGYIKRFKKIDRWKTKTLEATGDEDEQKTASVKTDAPKDETAQGPIAKFFTWLKGDGNATAPADPKVDSIENRAAMFPQ